MRRSFVFAAALLAACGGSTESPPIGSETATAASSATTAGAGGAGATSTTDTGFGGGFTGAGGSAPLATPVRSIEGLESITFYERTGGEAPTPYTFTVDGKELTTRLPDPLIEYDIPGAQTEYYDVYYSDHDGLFDVDGSYLTISGVFGIALPAGGGLNLAEIGLNFTDAPPEFGNYVAERLRLTLGFESSSGPPPD
jgi:hypothetical protein